MICICVCVAAEDSWACTEPDPERVWVFLGVRTSVAVASYTFCWTTDAPYAAPVTIRMARKIVALRRLTNLRYSRSSPVG